MDNQWIMNVVSKMGVSHKKTENPNQDSYLFDSNSKYSYMFVSDGHGSAAYLRSDIGANFATEAAKKHLEIFANNFFETEAKNISPVDLDALKNDIVLEWRKKTMAHYAIHPIYEEKSWEKVRKLTAKDFEKIHLKPKTMYGATLQAVVVCDKWSIFLKLGDGDMLTMLDDDVTDVMPEYSEQIGNATHSLCEDDAVRYMDCVLLDKIPKAVTVSSDGIANSFNSEDAIKALVKELYNDYLTATDDAIIIKSIEKLIDDCTTKGSGDDSTFGFMINIQALMQDKEKIAELVEAEKENARKLKLSERELIQWEKTQSETLQQEGTATDSTQESHDECSKIQQSSDNKNIFEGENKNGTK